MTEQKEKIILLPKRRFEEPKQKENLIIHNTIRSNVINSLRKSTDDEDMLTKLENEVFELSQKEFKKTADFSDPVFLNIYTHHAIYLIQNFDKDSYVYTDNSKKFENDKLSIKPLRLNNDKWKTHEERLNKIANEIMNATEETTDVYQCGKCKQRNCIYFISQTRSADEGFTVTIKCKTKNCNNSWREHS